MFQTSVEDEDVKYFDCLIVVNSLIMWFKVLAFE